LYTKYRFDGFAHCDKFSEKPLRGLNVGQTERGTVRIMRYAGNAVEVGKS
jgi:hypothetical protein